MSRIYIALRRLACRIFGHVRYNASVGTVGVKFCLRCLVITDQKTVRRSVTRANIEARMKAHPPEGYSFVDCNWKKGKAKFVNAQGSTRFIAI